MSVDVPIMNIVQDQLTCVDTLTAVVPASCALLVFINLHRILLTALCVGAVTRNLEFGSCLSN